MKSLRKKGVLSDFYTSRRTNLLGYPHVHSHIEFIFCLEGTLALSVDEATITLMANQVVVIMPYQIHSRESAMGVSEISIGFFRNTLAAVLRM